MFIVRFIFYFSISFVIMCFPLQERPIFDHAYHIISPITLGIFKVVKQQASSTATDLGQAVSSLWDGTTTVEKADSGRRLPRVPAESVRRNKKLPADEQYTLEEREILERVMREYHDKNKH